MGKKAIGIDIGGTGIKGAIVDLKEGRLASERVRYGTPEGGRPKDIADVVAQVIKDLGGASNLEVGICFPAVVQHGHTMSAANISDEWIGLDADSLFEKRLGRHVHVINDADAAGVAEVKSASRRAETCGCSGPLTDSLRPAANSRSKAK